LGSKPTLVRSMCIVTGPCWSSFITRLFVWCCLPGCLRMAMCCCVDGGREPRLIASRSPFRSGARHFFRWRGRDSCFGPCPSGSGSGKAEYTAVAPLRWCGTGRSGHCTRLGSRMWSPRRKDTTGCPRIQASELGSGTKEAIHGVLRCLNGCN
jgi:hypothetical protein